jgi:hypothetical protein
MYSNLRAEMARKKMSVSSLALEAGLCMPRLYDKINGKSKRGFSIKEGIAIKEVLGVDMPLEELFKEEE